MKIEKPNRVIHAYEQIINGCIDKIMPLYCPVREMDWCENWDPKKVYSNSGFVEKDCVFITPHEGIDTVWIVTEFDLKNGYVEMIYHTPGVLVTRLQIKVSPQTNKVCRVKLVYSKTSLSEAGNEILKQFTKKEFDIMMDSWEKAMNHYLKTGELLKGLPNF